MYSRELNRLNKCQVVLTDMRQHETVIKTNSQQPYNPSLRSCLCRPLAMLTHNKRKTNPCRRRTCACAPLRHIVNEQHMDTMVVRMSPIQPCYMISRRLSACKSTHQTSGVVHNTKPIFCLV